MFEENPFDAKKILHFQRISYIIKPCQGYLTRHMDGFPSGQRGQTVNLLQIASVVRIHLRPLHTRSLKWHSACTVWPCFKVVYAFAAVAELADARDLKSRG